MMDLRKYFLEGTEVDRATKIARAAVGAAAFAAFVAVGLNAVSRVIMTPTLSPNLFRERIVMPLIQPRKVREKLIEHTAEKSDFRIPQKTDRNPVVQKKEPEKVKPEPQKKPEPAKEPPKEMPKAPAVEAPGPVSPEPSPAPAPVRAAPAPHPAPAAAPAPAPAPRAASASDKSRALGMIVQVIEAHKRYPRRARQTNTEGTVVLAVKIAGDGTVISVDVSKKDASALLNRAALAAADKLLGMKLPVSAPLTVEVPVVFTLTNP